jgi:hypothetical protein
MPDINYAFTQFFFYQIHNSGLGKTRLPSHGLIARVVGDSVIFIETSSPLGRWVPTFYFLEDAGPGGADPPGPFYPPNSVLHFPISNASKIAKRFTFFLW